MSSRIASDREAAPLRFAQPSTLAIMDGGKRSATRGSLPVAGLPRPRFLGITDIDFFAIRGLYLNSGPP